MFKIRGEQMDAQSKAVREGFEDRLVELLRGQFPEAKDEPDPELRRAVNEQVERALGYGLEAERQVAIYLTTAWMLGQKFDDEFPGAKDILTSKLYAPDEKADRLAKWTERLFVALEEEG
jgi:hypothetical protein